VTAAALADFGSTFTKVTIVELGSGRLLARAQAPTTVHSDVMIGYRAALGAALSEAGPLDVGPRLAASSAAGGLRVAAIGLVEDLTAAAARQAALNAGARVGLVLHGQLDLNAVEALGDSRPEVVLFSGGTDGGQERMVIDNAEVVASHPLDTHFVVACNARIAEQIAKILGCHGARVDVVANVMPRIGELEVEPARAAITEAFVRHVIRGKGLSEGTEFENTVVMPTPEAVLQATQLLARDIGDVLVVDVGGATTDVHTVAGRVDTPGIRGPLLPALPVMRSVQGDLGLRSNAPSVLETDHAWLVDTMGLDESAVNAAAARRATEPDFVPVEPADWSIDRALAVGCVFHAIQRHCGRLIIASRPNQPVRISTDGPDLRRAPLVVGTGGILVRSSSAVKILQGALERCDHRSLTPRGPRFAIDSSYVLAAAGLLADIDPSASRNLMHGTLGAQVPSRPDPCDDPVVSQAPQAENSPTL
jgi:uncharacterized protein (TIGR01319 family)